MNRKTLPGGYKLWLIGLVTLVLSLAIAIDLTPWLRGPSGPFEWRWKYQPGLIPSRLVFVAIMVIILGGWYWLARRCERVSGWLLAALVPIGLAFQISVLATGPKGLQLVARVLNPAYYGYYPPALEYTDLPRFIDTYAEEQATLPHPHLQVHPPGNVVFLGLVYRAVEAVPALTELLTPVVEPRLASLPDWIDDYTMTGIVGGMVVSVLIPAIGALAAVPFFLFSRAAFGEEVARRTAILYLLMPALTLFEPKMNIPYTLLTALAFLLVYLGTRDNRLLYIYLSGLVCSLGNFMSYSMPLLSITVAVFVLTTSLIGWRESRKDALRRLAARLAVLLVGGLSVQVFMALFFGFDQVGSIRVMLDRTALYNDVRSYWYSLIYTPYDMLLFAGIPAAMLLLGRMVRLIGNALRRERLSLADWLLVGALVAMGMIILSGIQKAENARVFLYMIPGVVVFAAAETKDLDMGWRAFAVLAAVTFVQLMTFQIVLEVFL
jgi:hypothetical protein